jgi:hypothetical protein
LSYASLISKGCGGQLEELALRIGLLLGAILFSGTAVAETMPLNPAVTPTTIQSTICVKGWTASIRPPVSYTNRIKKQRMHEMGLPLELIGDFQLDHKLPLSLGGSPDDPRNLILQDQDEAEGKDAVERCLPAAVCAGAVSLSEAQQAIWNDWRVARHLCTVHPHW